jgi:hypothetical protein
MMSRTQCAVLVGLCLLGLGPRPAIAGIHTWDVSEVFSNADGTIQFVELVEANGGNAEGGVGNGTISTNAKSFSWANGAVTNTANKKYLVATQSFANLTGAPTPDAIITTDKLPFFFATSGDSVDFVIYDTCTFGAIPTNGKDSFDCVPNTTAVNSPTNYAGTTASVRAAIAQGNLDDFQNSTLQNWAGGGGAGGSPPTNQPNGQGGASDRFLQLSASSNFLGTYNKSQWAGNWVAAAVDTVKVDLNNSGGAPVSMRIMLLTPGCTGLTFDCTAWTSTNATVLPASSGWSTVSFSVKEANLTRVLGSDSYTASLSNVERLLIRHDDGTPDPPGAGTIVSTTLGIDNVLPEPSMALGLAAGAALLAAMRRRRLAA